MSSFNMRNVSCSFKAVLHPQYEDIKAECEPWILGFTKPASTEAAKFWLGCAIPFLCSIAYADYAADRVVRIVKVLTWIFVTDTDDDDPELRGCEDPRSLRERHRLILECYAGRLDLASLDGISKSTGTSINGLAELHSIWKEIVTEIRPKVLSRFLDGIKDHLNANLLQAHYRRMGYQPGVEEYMHALRRPTSTVGPCFNLLEYGLDIELDDETMEDELMQQLQEAAIDHVALYNDVFSCQMERSNGDYFNLPSVILNERRRRRATAEDNNNIAAHEDEDEDGNTFEEAMQEALRILKEVDERCVQLMEEIKMSALMQKPGVREYVKGLGLCMAGNVEWSYITARYAHVCSSEGLVRSVLD